MLKTIAPAEMKRVENRAMRESAITGEALMQTAAAHVARTVRRLAQGRQGRIICFCGAGNNGGDGLAAMRMLAQESGFEGECRMLPGTLSPDAEREMKRLRAEAPHVRVREAASAADGPTPVCIIDAMFGTGLSRPLEGEALSACQSINAWRDAGVPVVAVDIPSGLNGLTGDVLGQAVRASCTVTFHRPKPGLYLKEGPDSAGEILVEDIGLPAACDDADGLAVLEPGDLARLLPPRRRVSHKGSYGRVLLWAGSRGMAGAAAISAMAALRAGAGLVQVACPEDILNVVQTLCPCATCLPLPADAQEAWSLMEERLLWADALGAGCGLGTGPWARQLVKRLVDWLGTHALPTVLDADALNLLAGEGIALPGVMVTPHPAEAARLLGLKPSEVTEEPLRAARELNRRFGAVVLKGVCSVLCTGSGMAVNPFGTPGMAKGGSGDALTGICAALLAGRAAGAFRMDDLELLQTACALHGMAGELAEKQCGQRGMLATDLCACIGLVQAPQRPNVPEKAPTTLGRRVTVTVEHPLHSREEGPARRSYPVNCGYVQEVLHEQNEWQDACVLGENRPLEWFEGVVCGVVTLEDGRDLWMVAPEGEPAGEESMRRTGAFFGKVRQILF